MAEPGDPISHAAWSNAVSIPMWLFDRREISLEAKALYGRMYRYGALTDEWYPSQETLAKALGANPSTIRGWLKELTDAQLVRSTRRGLGLTNQYVFLHHRWIDEWQAPERVQGRDPERGKSTIQNARGDAVQSAPLGAVPIPMSSKSSSRTTVADSESPQQTIKRRPRKAWPAKEADDTTGSRNNETPLGGDPKSPEHRRGSGAGLANQFVRQAREAFGKTLGPGDVSPSAQRTLARNITAWRKEGIDPAVIETMIKIFCSEPRPPGKELWLAFVNSKRRLFEQATRVAQARRPAAEKHAGRFVESPRRTTRIKEA